MPAPLQIALAIGNMSRSDLVNTTFWLVQLPVSDSEQRSARSASSLTLSIAPRKLVVVAHDRGGLGHHVAQLLVDQVRVLAAAGALEQACRARAA